MIIRLNDIDVADGEIMFPSFGAWVAMVRLDQIGALSAGMACSLSVDGAVQLSGEINAISAFQDRLR